MTISEKAAYIKGLADGYGLSEETSEGKILSSVIDLLSDIGNKLAELEQNDFDFGDELDAISDDLAEVEEVVYGDYDYDDDYYDDGCCCDDPCCCGDDEDFMVSVECPTCHEEIVVDESILAVGKLECPNCGEKLELEYEYDEEDEEDFED